MIRILRSVTLATAALAATAGSVAAGQPPSPAPMPMPMARPIPAPRPMPMAPPAPPMPPLDLLHDLDVSVDLDLDLALDLDQLMPVLDVPFDLLRELPMPMAMGGAALALQAPRPQPAQPPQPPQPPQSSTSSRVRIERQRNVDSERLINQALSDIDDGDFDDAIERLTTIIVRFADASVAEATEKRVDAAMYWKAYAESKQRATTQALATVEEMRKKFADSRWMKDAMALALEVQQSVGQNVSPDSQPDEELKLLALRGLMQSDPDRGVPMIEQLLAGNSSVKVKENALFVLSQSRSPRAHEILANVARGRSNPDLQLRAIRYLGSNRNGDNLAILEEAYRNAGDERVKRTIIRSFMQAGDRTRLAAIANDANSSVALRSEAIQQLGILHADDELVRMYGRETNPQIKQRITQGLFISGNAGALVTLAKAERDPGMKKDIVSKLSNMKSKEATDYLMELLK